MQPHHLDDNMYHLWNFKGMKMINRLKTQETIRSYGQQIKQFETHKAQNILEDHIIIRGKHKHC